MADSHHSIAASLLGKLARLVIRRRVWFIWPQLILAAICVAYTALNLEFLTNRNALVGTDKKYHRIFLNYLEDFRDTGDLIAVIESENREKNREFVERLAQRLKTETNLFGEVFYKGDLTELGQKALLFLDENSLKELERSLRDFMPFIQKFSQTTNLNSLFNQVNREFIAAGEQPQSEAEAGSIVKGLPALERILEKGTESLGRSGIPVSPGVSALFGADEEAENSQYVTFGDGQFYLVSTRPGERDRQNQAVKRMRELVDETRNEVPGVNAGVTGEPVLIVDEMKQAQRDMLLASIVSLVVVALIFIFGYHETGRPIKATFCLLIGLAYTMGYTTLVVGHLNILTITFAPILIGLAIDLGVHLITRYEEELRSGSTEHEALEIAVVNTGQGIFTGAFTTAAAFFAMAFTDFDGIREMGIITGGGMLICLIPMVTALPALLLRGRQNVLDHQLPLEQLTHRARFERLWLARPGLFLGVSLALAVLASTPLSKVHFDYNLLHLQSKGLPAVVLEQRLVENASRSVIFGVSIADTPQEALELRDRFEKLDSVASVRTLAPLFEKPPPEKLGRIERIVHLAQDVQFQRPDESPVDVQALNQTVWGFQGYLKQALNELEGKNKPDLAAQLEHVYETTVQFRQILLRADPERAAEVMHKYQLALFEDIQNTFETLARQDYSGPMKPDDLPPSLKYRFVGKSGRHLVQIYPKGNAWERDVQETFVKQTRTVDPNTTGTPVQLYEYTSLLKNSYIESAWYALATIILLTLIHFRSFTAVLLVLAPVALGGIWTVGLMGLLDLPFNPANIMTLPLVIGIGVTNGIHMLNRFAEETHPQLFSNSTGKAVLVSGLTTIGGFASLMLAKHQGIASLGVLMSTGVATCMIGALTFLPALLSVLVKRGWTLKRKIEGPEYGMQSLPPVPEETSK